ncbi:MAG: DUF4383 domain-containing protein [Candidatus Dormibacteria bacterium]
MVSARTRAQQSPNQLFGYAFGAVYVLVGLVGFAVTPGVGFAATQGKNLIIFGVNPLHNLVHIAVGILLFGAAAAGASSSRAINLTVGTVYLLLGIVGFFAVNHSYNILALNVPDNFLHLATAVGALGVGLFFGRRAAMATA